MIRPNGFFILLALVQFNIGQEDELKVYKMCVPQIFYSSCLCLLEASLKDDIRIECVKGRDRLDCLASIQQNKADVMAVDVEDVYAAYQMGDQDFRIVAEFRIKESRNVESHYEAVTLIKKSSAIKSLKDLKGLKSCHAGFHRNVGYKIPMMKLKQYGLIEISNNTTISATERELQALSEFFPKSCLITTWYSKCPKTDKYLKEKYSNLCAICENPQQCKINDDYFGFDGAIRCLDKGDGDVAFTKSSSVQKYFGLCKNNSVSVEINHPENFEYLCEDGNRKPITGPICSWSKIPWRVYISSVDSVRNKQSLENLQKHLGLFFRNGLKRKNEDFAEDLFIESNLMLHKKNTIVTPKDYLDRFGYRNVIESNNSFTYKIRFCIETEIELEKCEMLSRAAFSRGIRPQLECYLSMENDCGKDLEINKKADIFIVAGAKAKTLRTKFKSLLPLFFEILSLDNLYVAVIDPQLTAQQIKKLPIKFDKSNKRSRQAAAILRYMRGDKSPCDENENIEDDRIQIVHSTNLTNHKDKMLLCMEQHRVSIDNYQHCMMEIPMPNFAYIKNNISNIELKDYQQAFILIQKYFGSNGRYSDVFNLYSEFKGHDNVIFHNNALGYFTPDTNLNAYLSAIIVQQYYEEIPKCFDK